MNRSVTAGLLTRILDLNIPACALVAFFMVLFLRLSKPSSMRRSEVFARIDIMCAMPCLY